MEDAPSNVVTVDSVPGLDEAQSVQVDYFAFDETHRHVLPDGTSWIEHRELNEGARRKYLNKTNREIKIRRGSGDAEMKVAAGDDRYELLKAAVVDWNLVAGNSTPVPFVPQRVDDFLTRTNPRVIDGLEKSVRKANPWLMAEMKPDDIREEMKNLEEMLKEAEERERREASFSSA